MPESALPSRRAQRFFVALNADARKLVDEVWKSEEVRGRVNENFNVANFSDVTRVREVVESIVVHFYDKIGHLEKEISRLNSFMTESKAAHHSQTRAYFQEMVNLKNQLRVLPKDRLDWAEGQADAALVFFDSLSLLDPKTQELVKDILTEKMSEIIALYPRVLGGGERMSETVDRLTKLNKDLESQLYDLTTKCGKLEARLAVFTDPPTASPRRRTPAGKKETAKKVTIEKEFQTQSFDHFRFDRIRDSKNVNSALESVRHFEILPSVRVSHDDKSVNTECIPPFVSSPISAVQETPPRQIDTEIACPPRPPAAPAILPPRPVTPVPVLPRSEANTVQVDLEALMRPFVEENGWLRDQVTSLQTELRDSNNVSQAMQERIRTMTEELINMKNSPLRRFSMKRPSRPDTAPQESSGGWRKEDDEEITFEEAAQIPYFIRAQLPQYAGKRRTLLYDDFLCDLEKEKRRAITVAQDAEVEVDGFVIADDTKSEGAFDEFDFLEQLRRRRRPSSSFFHRFLRGREVAVERSRPDLFPDADKIATTRPRRPSSCPPAVYRFHGSGWRLVRPGSSSNSSNFTRPTTGQSRSFSLVRGARPHSRMRFLLKQESSLQN